jgi:probable rRNA maturation factor
MPGCPTINAMDDKVSADDRPCSGGPAPARGEPAGFRIEVLGGPWGERMAPLARSASMVLGSAGLRGEARARVVGDDEMAAAHERHTGVPGTTDVLTFDLADEPGVIDADLLICADEAARQGAARGLPVEHELLLYIVHGVLHCAGYDDHDEPSASVMHEREDELLRAMGLGAVYAARGDGP